MSRDPDATEALLDDALAEIERLRAALTKITDPFLLEVHGVGVERALRIIKTMQAIAKDALSEPVAKSPADHQ